MSIVIIVGLEEYKNERLGKDGDWKSDRKIKAINSYIR
jgi:hypothetical protein